VTSWQELNDEAASCTRCGLYRRATQTVSGTIRPSAVLRGPDQEGRDRAYAGLVAGLVVAREAAEPGAAR